MSAEMKKWAELAERLNKRVETLIDLMGRVGDLVAAAAEFPAAVKELERLTAAENARRCATCGGSGRICVADTCIDCMGTGLAEVSHG